MVGIRGRETNGSVEETCPAFPETVRRHNRIGFFLCGFKWPLANGDSNCGNGSPYVASEAASDPSAGCLQQ